MSVSVLAGPDVEPGPGEGISLSTPELAGLIEAVHGTGAAVRFRARGNSMRPAIRDGDFITVHPLGELTPRRGDVLAFRLPGQPRLLVHRVRSCRRGRFLLQGDAVHSADGWVGAADALGIVTRVERGGAVRWWPSPLERPRLARLYFALYAFWPPLRRLLARVRGRLRFKHGP
ncbi:MAG: S24/S26 family peptidase [Acidobacteria bacterium]|nr:S24/S26 family peptidase [Acidobacteriota bacterium]